MQKGFTDISLKPPGIHFTIFLLCSSITNNKSKKKDLLNDTTSKGEMQLLAFMKNTRSSE